MINETILLIVSMCIDIVSEKWIQRLPIRKGHERHTHTHDDRKKRTNTRIKTDIYTHKYTQNNHYDLSNIVNFWLKTQDWFANWLQVYDCIATTLTSRNSNKTTLLKDFGIQLAKMTSTRFNGKMVSSFMN